MRGEQADGEQNAGQIMATEMHDLQATFKSWEPEGFMYTGTLTRLMVQFQCIQLAGAPQ